MKMNNNETKSKYEEILADPKKLAKLAAENLQNIALLEKARAGVLGYEVTEEKKIKKTPAGKIWDGQEKNEVTNEIRRFDPKLADSIAGEKNKRKIVKRIDGRIKRIRKENKKVESSLESLKARQLYTMERGGALVRKILEDMTKIKGLYDVEEKILKQNEKIRDEIKKHIESGAVDVENIDHFVALAKKLEENNKEDLKLKMKIAGLGKKLDELKKKATPIEEEFIEETEEIRRRRRKAA